MCCNAIGDYLPYYFLFKGQNLYSTWVTGGPADCHYNVSENGWMESAKFIDWFRNVFIEKTKHQDGPKLLILDAQIAYNYSVIRISCRK